MTLAVTSNNHIALLKDQSLFARFQNYLNLVRLSPKYKQNSLYNMYQPILPEEVSEIFAQEPTFTRKVKQLFNKQMSPSLIDTDDLMVAPSTYFIVCEMDGLKDEQLLYAERLKSVRRKVEIAYYKDGFHGMAPLIDSERGFKLSRKMLNDLAEYIKQNV